VSLAAGSAHGYPLAHAERRDPQRKRSSRGTAEQPAAPGFGGFSLPTNELGNDDFSNTSFGRLPETPARQGTGVIRVRRATRRTGLLDLYGEVGAVWSDGTVTPHPYCQPLAALAKASGWKVILGVNLLKQTTRHRAADEASAQRTPSQHTGALAAGGSDRQ